MDRWVYKCNQCGRWYVVRTNQQAFSCPGGHFNILPVLQNNPGGALAFRGNDFTVCSRCGGRFPAAAQFKHCDWEHDADGNATRQIITITLANFGSKIYEFTPQFKNVNPAVATQIETQHPGTNLPSGICRGICLDWIRRALLGANRPHRADAGKLEKLANRGAWAQGLSNNNFKTFAEDMAKKHTALKRGEEIKRPFTSVEEVAQVDPKEVAPSKFLESLLADSKFLGETCALVVFKPDDSVPGHMITIHRQNVSDTFHFFDPNFGVYNIITVAKLCGALEWLVREDHKISNPWMGYRIFQAAQAASTPAAPRPAAAGPPRR